MDLGGDDMATLTIRDVEEDVRASLRIRAARHGRSMEAEVREILRNAVVEVPGDDRLGTRIHQRFAAVGGAELDPIARTAPPRSADIA
jgi:antitoxin FitA